jgi:hypothetical protein
VRSNIKLEMQVTSNIRGTLQIHLNSIEKSK